MTAAELLFRYEATPADRQSVREIVAATGYFNPPEIDVAVELVDERLAKGDASEYYFVFGELAGQTVGYACYGPIPATQGSFDLYWVAVHPSQQGKGLGKILVRETERLAAAAGCRRLYIETSNRPQYASTRIFYEKVGYAIDAILKDYYAPGDDKVILSRQVAG